MSMSHPMTPAVFPVVQQEHRHMGRQLQEQHQTVHNYQRREGQHQHQVDNPSHQFACTYTQQKTQKRKKWHDGRLVLQSFGLGKLYDAFPPTGSGNPCLAQVDLPRAEIDSLIQGQQTIVEAEKYLIHVEGPWVEPKSRIDHLTSRPAVSTSMQKLMSRKFRKPTAFKPPDPQSERGVRDCGILGKRRRPLQPGELVRMYYGNSDPSQSMEVTDNGDHWQAQPPAEANGLSARNTSSHPQSSFAHLQRPPPQNSYNQNPPQDHNGYHNQVRQSHQHSISEECPGRHNLTNVNNQLGRGQDQNRGWYVQPKSNGIHISNSISSNIPHLSRNQANVCDLNPISDPPQSDGYPRRSNHHPPLQQRQSHENQPGFSHSNGGHAPQLFTKRNQFARNEFDPKSYYGGEEEEEESDEDSNPFAPGLGVPQFSFSAEARNKENRGPGSTSAANVSESGTSTNKNATRGDPSAANERISLEDILEILGGGDSHTEEGEEEDKDDTINEYALDANSHRPAIGQDGIKQNSGESHTEEAEEEDKDDTINENALDAISPRPAIAQDGIKQNVYTSSASSAIGFSLPLAVNSSSESSDEEE